MGQAWDRLGTGLRQAWDRFGISWDMILVVIGTWLSIYVVRVFFDFTYNVTAIVASSNPMVIMASTTAIVT